jgi:hypothetical protein
LIEKLEELIVDVGALHSKLILLIGSDYLIKSTVLELLAKSRNIEPLNIGVGMGCRLSVLPQRQRGIQASNILRELVDQYACSGVLLIKNIELLFDRTLKLDPLDMLKRNAHSHCIVAIWPGDVRNDRLIYAEMGHPEYQDYSLEGLVTFQTNS